ncbi:MAG TPA: aspartate 1-decarboxylase [bacterium]|nr:aspartate 1-decarboxylase [bacterium]
MRRTMLKSKIHRAIVTDASVDYEGSITIDRALMDAADLLEYEQVHIWDVTNGARLVTYVIEGAPGSGTISINGAAALLINRGDKIIIGSYGEYDESEVRNFQPRKIFVDEGNRPVKK